MTSDSGERSLSLPGSFRLIQAHHSLRPTAVIVEIRDRALPAHSAHSALSLPRTLAGHSPNPPLPLSPFPLFTSSKSDSLPSAPFFARRRCPCVSDDGTVRSLLLESFEASASSEFRARVLVTGQDDLRLGPVSPTLFRMGASADLEESCHE